MRHWLLTSTTYGTWLPGDSRGSVTSVRDLRYDDPDTICRIEHDIPGEPYEAAIPTLEQAARGRLKCAPIYFGQEHASIIVPQFLETANYRQWNLLAAAVMYNHFHLVVEVPGDPSPDKILGDFKAYASRALNRRFRKPLSETWWTSGGSMRKLGDPIALRAGANYVLVKQPKPLVVWMPASVEQSEPS